MVGRSPEGESERSGGWGWRQGARRALPRRLGHRGLRPGVNPRCPGPRTPWAASRLASQGAGRRLGERGENGQRGRGAKPRPSPGPGTGATPSPTRPPLALPGATTPPGLNRRRRRRCTCTARLRKVPASAASFFTLKSMMFMPDGRRAEPPAALAGRRGAPRPGWGAGRRRRRRRGGRGRWREAAPGPRSCRFLRGRRRRWRGEEGRGPRARERAPRCSHAGPVASPSSCEPRGPRSRPKERPAPPRRRPAAPRLCNRGGKQPAGGGGAWPHRGRGVGAGVLAGTATPAGWPRSHH